MTTIIALKPYLDEVKDICDGLSHEELSNFIVEFAKELPTKERNKFLKKCKTYCSGEEKICICNQNMTLNRINELKQEIIERQESIDDGSYYDDFDYRYDDYDEECPDPITEEQKEELEKLFYEADELFLADKLVEAKEIYESLIYFFDITDNDEEWLDLGTYEVKINWKETLARYCRCVYEISSPEDKIKNVIDALRINSSQEKEDLPYLQDIYNTKVNEPADWKIFLQNLKEKLRGNNNARAFVLFLECINDLTGLDDVEIEVKKYKISAGYLYLLNKLVDNKLWGKAADIAQEAINNISDDLRLDASEILINAAKELKNPELLLKGKREAFFSDPDNTKLQLLIEEAKEQELRKEELEKVIKFLNKKNNYNDFSLKIEAMFMVGEIESAIEIVNKNISLGWSYKNEIGLSFSGVLMALGINSEAKTQEKLLKEYIPSEYLQSEYLKITKEKEFIFQEISEGLSKLNFDNQERQKLFALIEKLGKARIDGIVSNQHRGAYERAALVLGALAECYVLQNNKAQARLLINEYQQKFNRHTAFKKEITDVIKSSCLLNKLK